MKQNPRNHLSLLLALPFFFACAPAGDEEATDDAMMDGEMEMTPTTEAMVPDMEMPGEPCWVNPESQAQEERASPLRATSFEYEGGAGTICYGSPSVRERTVFGELVPFGEPWRLGANEATAIHLTGPASIGGVALEAGSYSVYATPMMEGDWEITFNSMVERWGIPFTDEVLGGDVGSFTVTPEATEEPVEMMTFTFEPWDNPRAMGDLVMSWADTRITMHVHPAG